MVLVGFCRSSQFHLFGCSQLAESPLLAKMLPSTIFSPRPRPLSQFRVPLWFRSYMANAQAICPHSTLSIRESAEKKARRKASLEGRGKENRRNFQQRPKIAIKTKPFARLHLAPRPPNDSILGYFCCPSKRPISSSLIRPAIFRLPKNTK